MTLSLFRNLYCGVGCTCPAREQSGRLSRALPLPPPALEGQRPSRLAPPTPRGPRDSLFPRKAVWARLEKRGQTRTTARVSTHSLGRGRGATRTSRCPRRPPRAARSDALTLLVKPSAHKEHGDAHEGQGQEGSDRHARQLEGADRARQASEAAQPSHLTTGTARGARGPAAGRWLPWWTVSAAPSPAATRTAGRCPGRRQPAGGRAWRSGQARQRQRSGSGRGPRKAAPVSGVRPVSTGALGPAGQSGPAARLCGRHTLHRPLMCLNPALSGGESRGKGPLTTDAQQPPGTTTT